jgi:hypothetical protein
MKYLMIIIFDQHPKKLPNQLANTYSSLKKLKTIHEDVTEGFNQ